MSINIVTLLFSENIQTSLPDLHRSKATVYKTIHY